MPATLSHRLLLTAASLGLFLPAALAAEPTQGTAWLNRQMAALAERHGAEQDALVADTNTLSPLVAEGWVVVEGARVAIVDHGPELARVVASAFDAYLTEGAARHSVAV